MSGTGLLKPIGLVTVSFRSGAEVAKLIDSLKLATRNPVEVVVVDNFPGGDKDLAGNLKGRTYKLISRPDNPGYGAGMNSGIEALPKSIELILVVNPDVAFQRGAIDGLIAAIGETGVGAVGPRIIDESGETYPSARSIPSLRLGIGHALFGNILPRNPWTRSYLRQGDYDSTRDAGWLSGACLLVKREAFEKVGGFDPGYFMYFEDVDLGYRLGAAGYRSVYVPNAVVEHEGGHSTKGISKLMLKAHHDSAKRWVTTRYAGPAWAPIRWSISIGLWVRLFVNSRR